MDNKLLHIVEAIYPTVDFSKTKIVYHLPWLTRVFSPKTVAITLPFFRRTYIFFKSKKHFQTPILVHECCHVYQRTKIGSWWLFYIKYFLASLRGYGRNKYEIQAYNSESCYRAAGCPDNTLSITYRSLIMR